MEFKIEKLKNYTFIQVLEEKLDTHIAPTLEIGIGACVR